MNRKKSKGTRLLCTSRMLTVIIVLSVFTVGIGILPVSAQLASVTRDLPVYVQPGEEFEVTLAQTGFDSGMGTVVETLPVGFEYVDGSYTGGGANKEETVTYDEGTRKLRATYAFVDEEEEELFLVTYRVTASLTEQNAVFEGEYAAWTGAGVEVGDVGGDPEVGVDGTLPETSNHVPARGAGGVSVDTNIVVDVTDNNAVDPTTITMKIDSDAIPMILGESLFFVSMSHYTINYDPADDFDYSTVYQVTIDASDAAGNAMTDTYVFQTELPDTDPPEITNVVKSAITTNSATITWDTDEIADSLVKYGTTQGGPYTEQEYNAAGVTAHSIGLLGLDADTTYYYVVNSTDPSGNPAESGEDSFMTLETPDTTPPVISNIDSSSITMNSATITWDTNESANSLVKYGTTQGGPYTEEEYNAAYETAHSIGLTELAANTTYYYVVNSTDPSGNPAQSGEDSFTTAAGYYGDVDLNGEVTAGDATLILRYTVDYPGTFDTPYGPMPYADIGDMPLADVDFSGEVDAGDATCILRYTVDYPGYENLPTEGHPV